MGGDATPKGREWRADVRGDGRTRRGLFFGRGLAGAVRGTDNDWNNGRSQKRDCRRSAGCCLDATAHRLELIPFRQEPAQAGGLHAMRIGTQTLWALLLAGASWLTAVCAVPPAASSAEAPVPEKPAAAPEKPAETVKEAKNESANFLRDVMPLLTKLGCNAIQCHGSSVGQGRVAAFDVRRRTRRRLRRPDQDAPGTADQPGRADQEPRAAEGHQRHGPHGRREDPAQFPGVRDAGRLGRPGAPVGRRQTAQAGRREGLAQGQGSCARAKASSCWSGRSMPTAASAT